MQYLMLANNHLPENLPCVSPDHYFPIISIRMDFNLGSNYLEGEPVACVVKRTSICLN